MDSSQSSSLRPSGGTGPLREEKVYFPGNLCLPMNNWQDIHILPAGTGRCRRPSIYRGSRRERKKELWWSYRVTGEMKGFFFSLSAWCKKTPWAHEQKITSGTAGNRTPQEMPLHQTATALHEGGVLCGCVSVKTRKHAQTKEMRVQSADKIIKKSTVGNNFLWLQESSWIWNGDKISSSALNVFLCYKQSDSKAHLKTKANFLKFIPGWTHRMYGDKYAQIRT